MKARDIFLAACKKLEQHRRVCLKDGVSEFTLANQIVSLVKTTKHRQRSRGVKAICSALAWMADPFLSEEEEWSENSKTGSVYYAAYLAGLREGLRLSEVDRQRAAKTQENP